TGKVTPLSSEAKQYKKQRSQEQIAKISDYKS
ncbi:D-alanyl-D-alanine endopeptidase, partial [Vibrio cholerae]